MTHMRPMAETEGNFKRGCGKLHTCKECRKKEAVCQRWDSSCGGYEDYKFECASCGYSWWEEGIDS